MEVMIIFSESLQNSCKQCFKSDFISGFGSSSHRLENKNQVESLFLHAVVDTSPCFGWETGNYLLHILGYDKKQWALKVSLWKMWKKFSKPFALCECVSLSAFLQAVLIGKES